MDLPTLQAARPDLLEQAAAHWTAVAARLAGLSGQFRVQTEPLFAGPGAWLGAAANAATTSLSALSDQLTATSAGMNAMAASYRDAAAGVSGAQALVQAASDLAARNGLEIRPDGEVTWATPALPGPLEQAAQDFESLFRQLPPAAAEAAGLVAKALRLASEVDSQVSEQLARLPGAAAAVKAVSTLGAEIGSEMLPPAGMSPKEINDWWTALGAAAQQQLIRQFPARIGWLNGLPATARDQANRLAVHEDQASLNRKLAQLEAHPPTAYFFDGAKVGDVPNPAYQAWLDQIASIRSQLLGLHVLLQDLAKVGTNGVPQAYLLGFSTSGNGHVIIAYGNPDTAGATATYVPGTGATMIESGADADRAIALWQQAHKLDPAQSVSSVLWLGYDAPRIGSNAFDLVGDLNLLSTAPAAAGARSLASFQAGLAAAHGAGIPDRTVLIGHSYGSLVTADTAAKDGFRPTDMIFVGSPGVGVSTASQLGLPPGHVWAGANVNDPVPDLPPNIVTDLPGIGIAAGLGGVGGLITHGLSGIAQGAEQGAMAEIMFDHLQNPDASFYGANPATPAFGGQVFNANDVPGDPSAFNQAYFDSFHAHNTYWSQGSSSLRNMAAIVAGKYSQVTLASGGG